MKNITRRKLLLSTFAITAGTFILPISKSWAAVELEPTDSMASRLGYTKDSTKVDGGKYPAHTNDQSCSGCAQFQSEAGTCRLFAGKKVSPNGWCMSWAKKK